MKVTIKGQCNDYHFRRFSPFFVEKMALFLKTSFNEQTRFFRHIFCQKIVLQKSISTEIHKN
jgi:hypothetical protein